MTIQYERLTVTQRRRPACGAPMRDGDRCAKRPGHDPKYGHRTAYSLDNLRAYRMKQRAQEV